MQRTGLDASSVVADVGAGTGALTHALTKLVGTVYAIEPVADMRAQIATETGAVILVAGTAEQTTLPDASIDAVFVGQALHWFDPSTSVPEWRRVLRRERWVVALWNDLRSDDPMTKAMLDVLARHATVDISQLGHRGPGRERVLADFVAVGGRLVEARDFDNSERLGPERLEAFLSSASYLPAPGTERFATLLDEAHAVLGDADLRPWRTRAQVLEL